MSVFRTNIELSRRMSAQSIFTDPDKRGTIRGDSSLARDYSAPILELFHENEVIFKLVLSTNVSLSDYSFIFLSFQPVHL